MWFIMMLRCHMTVIIICNVFVLLFDHTFVAADGLVPLACWLSANSKIMGYLPSKLNTDWPCPGVEMGSWTTRNCEYYHCMQCIRIVIWPHFCGCWWLGSAGLLFAIPEMVGYSPSKLSTGVEMGGWTSGNYFWLCWCRARLDIK